MDENDPLWNQFEMEQIENIHKSDGLHVLGVSRSCNVNGTILLQFNAISMHFDIETKTTFQRIFHTFEND